MSELTANEIEVLADLEYLTRYDAERAEAGVAPLQFGGSNGSHHASTATRLAAKGLVDRRYRGLDWGEPKLFRYRGSCVYRINSAGLAVLKALPTPSNKEG